MAAELLAQPAELRVWLGLAAGDTAELSDELANLVLEGVSSSILAYCRRTAFATDTVTGERVDGSGTTQLVLAGAPVTDVTKVVEDPDGEGTEITEVVDWGSDGILERTDGRFVRRRRWYEVDYTHGYEEVAEAVRNVCLRVAARAVSNPEGLGTETVGGYAAGFSFDESRLPALAAPDWRELDPFRL